MIMSGTQRTGTSGSDTILSQQPSDTLIGGAGDDVYDILHYGTVVREDAGGGIDVVIAHIDYALPDFVEDLSLEYADRGHIPNPATRGPLIGIGNGLSNTIGGNALDNKLYGMAGNDTLLGNGGDDSLDGGGGNDLLSGGVGHDLLFGGAGNDNLLGGRGNDIFIGGAGDDVMFGNEGLDLAQYDGSLRGSGASHRVTRDAANNVTITSNSGDGVDSLSGVELIVVGLDVVLTSQPTGTARNGFDEALYLSRNSDVASAVQSGRISSGLEHFQRFGEREGRDPNAVFDADYYLAQNSDVAAAVSRGQTTAWSHYSNYGWREGRDPSAWFNTRAYMDNNPDATGGGLNPLLHFLHIGAAEGRLAQVSNGTLDWIG